MTTQAFAATAAILILFLSLGIVGRVPRSARNRRAISPGQPRESTPLNFSTIVITAGTIVTVTFDEPAIGFNAGVVWEFTDGGVLVPYTSVAQSADKVAAFTFVSTVGIDGLTVPAGDALFRTSSGGSVQPGDYTVPFP